MFANMRYSLPRPSAELRVKRAAGGGPPSRREATPSPALARKDRCHAHRHRPRRHAHREREAARWPLGRETHFPAHAVRNATVGGIRDARTAGIRPANAPIRMAEAMPPVHASAGITTAQCFELAYTAVAATPTSTPAAPPITASRIDSARN